MNKGGMKSFRIVFAWAVVFVGVGVEAAGLPKQIRRAAPPTTWDKLTESQFNADAFSLLEGGRPASFARTVVAATDPAPKSDDAEEGAAGNGDFDRRDMMKKLEAAEQSVAELMSSEKSFTASTARMEQASDLFVMMGRTLFSNDPDYADDDTYLKHAEDMTGFAKQMKVLAKKGDYSGTSTVFGKLKTTCNACHEGYR